jgi:hypothetical protein
MTVILLCIFIIIVCFGGVLLFGAPYLPTLGPQVIAALELADLKAGDMLLELGCGDGKVLIAAAKMGVHGVGYELNPILAGVAWMRTIRYRKTTKVICGDFWRQTWPPADAIFVFLLDRYMAKLDHTIGRYDHRPVKLVSFAFKVPHKKPQEVKKGVYLYNYVAKT